MDDRQYRCLVCSRTAPALTPWFDTFQEAAAHVRRHHAEVLLTMFPDELLEQRLPQVRGRSVGPKFDPRPDLERKCLMCPNATFATLDGMLTHMASIHELDRCIYGLHFTDEAGRQWARDQIGDSFRDRLRIVDTVSDFLVECGVGISYLQPPFEEPVDKLPRVNDRDRK